MFYFRLLELAFMSGSISDEATESVTNIAKEVVGNKEALRQRFMTSAKAFGEIMNDILRANDHTIQWFDEFRYCDLDDKNGFDNIMKRYHLLAGPDGYRDLKWSCTKIKKIYDDEIRPHIAGFLNDPQVIKANRVFDALIEGDEKMKAFVKDIVLAKLRTFVDQVEPLMEAGKIQEAKKIKLQFRISTREIYDQLKKLNDDLEDLVLKFDEIAG